MKKFAFALLPLGVACAGMFSYPETPVQEAPQQDLRRISQHLTVLTVDSLQALTFCGETVPMSSRYVKDKLQRQLDRFSRYTYSNRIILKRSARYKETFVNILREEGIPEDFFFLAITESNLANVGSPVGAKGFWQFMKPTAKAYGLEVSATVDERYHPEKATRAAARYLKRAYAQFGDWALVAAAYNMGSGGLRKQMRSQSKVSYYQLDLNAETSAYVYKILAYKYLLSHPEMFGLDLTRSDVLQPIPYKAVYVTENIDDLATFAKMQGIDLQQLKTLNPWLIANQLIVKPGKTYQIRIPLVQKLVADELVVEPYEIELPAEPAADSTAQPDESLVEESAETVPPLALADSTDQA